MEPAPAESLPPPSPDGALLAPIAEEASPSGVDASASPDGFSLSPEDLPLNDVLPAAGAAPVGRPAPTEAPPAPIAAPPPLSATLTVSGVGAWTTRWTYDAADRMWTMTNPDGEVVTATYDAAGQALGLESAWPAGGAGTTRTLAANATYNGLGQRNSVGYGNGTTQHWRYYGQETQNWGQQHYGRLRQTCVITTAATCPDDDRDGAGTKLSLHYWYDAAGNVRYVDDRSGRWKTAGVWAQGRRRRATRMRTTRWTG